MTLLLLRYVGPLLGVAALCAAIWLHGYQTANGRAKAAQAAAVALARADAERQARAIDGLQVEIDALRARKPIVRERLVEVAKEVVREVPADCRLPAILRRLWDTRPGDAEGARSAGGPDDPVPAVATDRGRG